MFKNFLILILSTFSFSVSCENRPKWACDLPDSEWLYYKDAGMVQEKNKLEDYAQYHSYTSRKRPSTELMAVFIGGGMGYTDLYPFFWLENSINTSLVNNAIEGYVINAQFNINFYYYTDESEDENNNEGYHTTTDRNGREHCRASNGQFADDELCSEEDELAFYINGDINKIFRTTDISWTYAGAGLLLSPQSPYALPYANVGIRVHDSYMIMSAAVEAKVSYKYFALTGYYSFGIWSNK